MNFAQAKAAIDNIATIRVASSRVPGHGYFAFAFAPGATQARILGPFPSKAELDSAIRDDLLDEIARAVT